MKIGTNKTQLWQTWYWSVNFRFDEYEYDDDPTWALNLKGRGWCGGVLTGVLLLHTKPTTRTPDERVTTVRATIIPLKKDGSHSVRAETIDFDDSNFRFARLPEIVKEAYRTMSESVDDFLRREEEINAEHSRRRVELMGQWRDLFVPADEEDQQ